MTLIRKGLVGLAALLAFSAQPAQGKERDSKILQCPVATYWQEFLEEQYAKSAPQAKTNEDKENLRLGYCAFGSEKYPLPQSGLETAVEYIKKANAEERDPVLGVAYYMLGLAYAASAENFHISTADSVKAIDQQISAKDFNEKASKVYFKKARDTFRKFAPFQENSNLDLYSRAAERRMNEILNHGK